VSSLIIQTPTTLFSKLFIIPKYSHTYPATQATNTNEYNLFLVNGN
jgi:hypothetical protein